MLNCPIMSHDHTAHSHAHCGHTHDTSHLSDVRLVGAVLLNFGLTVAELIGGILFGSLALMADALHNFNDCLSLIVALIARRIARKPADQKRTFGYRRAEVIGSLINLTALILVGVYLLYEAIARIFDPQEISGWPVIIIAGIALAVDLGTALLLLRMAKGNLNVRAAFLHNLADALGSVGVIIVGIAVILWDAWYLDVIMTFLISAYILWHSTSMIRESIHILMESVPENIQIEELIERLRAVDGVDDVHHLHLWQLDETQTAFEGHLVVPRDRASEMESIKSAIRTELANRFQIHHSTLEIEFDDEECNGHHVGCGLPMTTNANAAGNAS